jgi:hypothetical protein
MLTNNADQAELLHTGGGRSAIEPSLEEDAVCAFATQRIKCEAGYIPGENAFAHVGDNHASAPWIADHGSVAVVDLCLFTGEVSITAHAAKTGRPVAWRQSA